MSLGAIRIMTSFFYLIGFTFSFPCKQEGLASARLTSWTKGFSCSGVVNEDVVKLLQEAIHEKVRSIALAEIIDPTTIYSVGYQCEMCGVSQRYSGHADGLCLQRSIDGNRTDSWNGHQCMLHRASRESRYVAGWLRRAEASDYQHGMGCVRWQWPFEFDSHQVRWRSRSLIDQSGQTNVKSNVDRL